MVCEEDWVIEKIWELYGKISSLESLKPGEKVDGLFRELVGTCIRPSTVDVRKLPKTAAEMRSHLIKLCGEAEGLLESHYSAILCSLEDPLDHLHLFPYYNNYVTLSLLEYSILKQHSPHAPATLAFVGSGPLPFTSILLASRHLPTTTFHNYDIDPLANSMALRLFSNSSSPSSRDLSTRMLFHTSDILHVTHDLNRYDVVFLAALVGMDSRDKSRVLDHLTRHMAPGALLMLRSAHAARAFLYPVVDPSDLPGFQVLSVFHPTDDVINSVLLARKLPPPLPPIILPNKCSEMQPFSPLHPNIIDEFAIDDQLS